MRDRKLLISLSLVAVVVLLNLPVPATLRLRSASRDNLAPFQNIMSLFMDKVRSVGAALIGGSADREEVPRLLAETAHLRQRVRELEQLEEDNRDLRRLLGFRQRNPHRLILCSVVARGDASGWWQTVRLDKGRRDGIELDMAVMTADGLIGKTIHVSQRTCDALLITDPNCRVACRFPRTGGFGVVRGRGVTVRGRAQLEMLSAARPAVMDYIPRDVTVREGDRIVTSGLGGVFPEGLLVGYAADTEMDASGLFQRAAVTPAARMDSLRHVFVVRPGDEAGEPRPDSDAGAVRGAER